LVGWGEKTKGKKGKSGPIGIKGKKIVKKKKLDRRAGWPKPKVETVRAICAESKVSGEGWNGRIGEKLGLDPPLRGLLAHENKSRGKESSVSTKFAKPRQAPESRN